MISASRLRSGLADEPFVRRLVVRSRVTSTNDVARRLAARGAVAGTVVVAVEQTAGRGRLGRVWHSPAGDGIYVSVLVRPRSSEPALAARWTLGGAVAACEACRALGAGEVGIKWPNDLVWRGRKVGGVLAEMRTQAGRPTEMVLGTGVNLRVGEDRLPAELRGSAASLAEASGGRSPDPCDLITTYVKQLAGVVGCLDGGQWREVARRWDGLAVGARGQRVRVASGSIEGTIEGITDGLAEDGALRVVDAAGHVLEVRMVDAIRPSEQSEER